eukprot:s629_g13.t1
MPPLTRPKRHLGLWLLVAVVASSEANSTEEQGFATTAEAPEVETAETDDSVPAAADAQNDSGDLEPSADFVRLAKSACQLCPVRLVEVASKDDETGEAGAAGLHLNEAGLEYLAAQRSPLFLVPALGVYRGGKSLLLNRLMGLKAPYAGGFGVGHGQQTFTRGIDICAEPISSGGTVVWMDTEGLFSSEDARSSYGPKIFSLALLFSSAVLLNNLKVLNQQFFVFFEEQQQVARILREGLRSEGLQSEMLLADKLPLVWVLQQPINFTATVEASQQQLDAFITIEDQARQRVREDFRHSIHEVPTATHDSRQWPKLDQVPDEELLPEYIESTRALRNLLLKELQNARPLQAASIAAYLRMYVDLVQNDHFSVSLAREAFEDSHIAQLCESFGAHAEALSGQLPSAKLPASLDKAEESIREERDKVIKEFHLDETFLRRLRQCLQKKREDLESTNSELVLAEWKNEALSIADSGGCFFLGTLAKKLPAYREKYGKAFDDKMRAKAQEYGSDLQRARLTGCVHLYDFLLPLAPWLAWPVVSLYLRQGLVSGILAMILHGIVLAGIYTMLQFMNQLPPYLDLQYQVLKHHPGLRSLVMRAPQTVPWSTISKVFGLMGAVHSAWRLLTNLSKMLRSLSQGSSIGQLTNLELKLNMVLEHSQADMKKTIVMSALEAAVYIDSSDAPAAALIKIIVLSAGGKRRRPKGRRGEWAASPSPPPSRREAGLQSRQSDNDLTYIEHNFTMEIHKPSKDADVGSSVYGPGWRRLVVPAEPAAAVAPRAYEPLLQRRRQRPSEKDAGQELVAAEERSPPRLPDTLDTLDTLETLETLESREVEDMQEMQEQAQESRKDTTQTFVQEQREGSEGDGDAEQTPEDVQSPQEHMGSSLRNTFMKVLVQVLRHEGCSTEFQHRISRAVETGLSEVLDTAEPEDSNTEVMECMEDAGEMPSAATRDEREHEDDEFEQSRRKVAECLKQAAEFGWEDLRAAEKESSKFSRLLIGRSFDDYCTRQDEMERRKELWAVFLQEADDFQRARRRVAESLRRAAEDMWLPTGPETVKVEAEVESHLCQVATSLRRAAQGQATDSRSGMLSACSVATSGSSKVGVTCEEAVGLLIQYSDSEDETCTENDDHAMCQLKAAQEVSEEAICSLMLHVEDFLDLANDDVVDLDYVDEV